jgi:hypothetical protein
LGPKCHPFPHRADDCFQILKLRLPAEILLYLIGTCDQDGRIARTPVRCPRRHVKACHFNGRSDNFPDSVSSAAASYPTRSYYVRPRCIPRRQRCRYSRRLPLLKYSSLVPHFLSKKWRSASNAMIAPLSNLRRFKMRKGRAAWPRYDV